MLLSFVSFLQNCESIFSLTGGRRLQAGGCAVSQPVSHTQRPHMSSRSAALRLGPCCNAHLRVWYVSLAFCPYVSFGVAYQLALSVPLSHALLSPDAVFCSFHHTGASPPSVSILIAAPPSEQSSVLIRRILYFLRFCLENCKGKGQPLRYALETSRLQVQLSSDSFCVAFPAQNSSWNLTTSPCFGRRVTWYVLSHII